MKDSLFEMLMSFFEQSLAQLKESQTTKPYDVQDNDDNLSLEESTLHVNSPQNTTMRLFTLEERNKLTKSSYQFLTRLMLLRLIAQETMELIINQLFFSESRFVGLQETKWTIRNALANNLDANQLAFLDLVLYQKEDKLTLQ